MSVSGAKNEPQKLASCIFFRPTPMALARSFIKPESQLHFAKFTELMQWQHHYDDNVHQKGELDGIDT